jgi:ribosomal protein S18 acetylase RimI-like enzyme
MIIRLSTPEDAAGIAHVRLNSWRTTYQGLVPESMLNHQSHERAMQNWSERLANPNNVVYVAATETGDIVGYGYGGRERTHVDKYDCEIYALYLLKDFQRKGLGKGLICHLVAAFIQRGWHSMTISALATNTPACDFYLHIGGRAIGKNVLKTDEGDLEETTFGYEDLELMAAKLCA